MSGPTVGDVLRIIAALPQSKRDQEKIRLFVMTLSQNQNEQATPSQINQAKELVK